MFCNTLWKCVLQFHFFIALSEKALWNIGKRSSVKYNFRRQQRQDLKKRQSLAEKMETPFLFGHVAVSLQNYVLVFAGDFHSGRCRMQGYVMRFIWSYNLYTERWRKYRFPVSKSIPHMSAYGASAVAIGNDVYMFGLSNSVWQLTIKKYRCFTWTQMPEKAQLRNSITPTIP